MGDMGNRKSSAGDPYFDPASEANPASIVGIASYAGGGGGGGACCCCVCNAANSSCGGSCETYRGSWLFIRCCESTEFVKAESWFTYACGLTRPPRFKCPPPPMAMAGDGRFTRRPSGRIWASAHLAPNLQFPYSQWSAPLSTSSPTRITEINTFVKYLQGA